MKAKPERYYVDFPKTPKALDSIVDVVLAYRPKPKSKPATKRRNKRRRLAKDR